METLEKTMGTKQVTIVIPVYKTVLSEHEKISMDQARNVFSGYDIWLIAPESLLIDFEHGGCVKRFDDYYFQSVDTYSELLLSLEFYSAFLEYEYMLIYQLDAFVFYDDLEYFCNLGYDYIGAPWIDGIPVKIRNKTKILFVGNGGLCLRNIQSVIRLLNDYYEEAQSYKGPEDFFFSYHDSRNFRVAPVKQALKFAFELKNKRCFLLNKQKLPFGCHAWERYNIEFWKPYIESYGYKINTALIEGGNWDKKFETGILRKVSAFILRKIVDCKKIRNEDIN